MRITVLLTPGAAPVSPHAAAVIVDVLRATSTLTVALTHGAARVLPAASPEEAFALRRDEAGALLCGERGGRRIPGFDLGNSPDEYLPSAVSSRTLIFASTNGSRAMVAAASARRRVLGAFINASAVVEAVAREADVVVVCAGEVGRFSFEDAAFAGLLCERLAARGATIEGPAARFARTLAPCDASETRALVQGSSHGRALRSLGYEFARDVEFCAGLDRVNRAFEI
jgi:2-phosphosulfolactate phosphatase